MNVFSFFVESIRVASKFGRVATRINANNERADDQISE